jgi:long-chain acyl-CoA synthetase
MWRVQDLSTRLEEALFKHPAVQLPGVVGVPDECRGETVKAFLVFKDGMTASEEEIIGFCREHLAKYKVPTSVEFRKELPVSALDKALRRELANE